MSDINEQEQERVEDLHSEFYNRLVGGFRARMYQMDLAQIGRLFVDYIMESEHSGWEGFSRSEQIVIATLLHDMDLYAAASELDPQDLSLYFGGVGGWDSEGKISKR